MSSAVLQYLGFPELGRNLPSDLRVELQVGFGQSLHFKVHLDDLFLVLLKGT